MTKNLRVQDNSKLKKIKLGNKLTKKKDGIGQKLVTRLLYIFLNLI